MTKYISSIFKIFPRDQALEAIQAPLTPSPACTGGSRPDHSTAVCHPSLPSATACVGAPF